jgi:hypothetical protein
VTKAQGIALLSAMEQARIPCSLVLGYDGAGGEVWTLALSTADPYTGPQLAELAAYCQSNGLTLSAMVSEIGVV